VAGISKTTSDRIQSEVDEHRKDLDKMGSAKKLEDAKEEAVKELRRVVSIFEGLDKAENVVSETNIGCKVRG